MTTKHQTLVGRHLVFRCVKKVSHMCLAATLLMMAILQLARER